MKCIKKSMKYFFHICTMPTEYAKKTKKGIGKRQVKGIKTFLKKNNKKKQETKIWSRAIK